MPNDIQQAIQTGIQEASPNGREAITPDQARALLAQEQQARVEACKQELEALLARHKCRMDVFVILRAGQVIPQVQIVAAEG